MMTGEVTRFRKRFLGGFNRHDVIAYISKITQERNESVKAREIAEREAESLQYEVEKLRKDRVELYKKLEMYGRLINEMRSQLNETALADKKETAPAEHTAKPDAPDSKRRITIRRPKISKNTRRSKDEV